MAFCPRLISRSVAKHILAKSWITSDTMLSSQVASVPHRYLPIAWSSTTWNQEYYDSKSALADENEERTKYVESKDDFKYVERLIPTFEIPKPPVHESYPTPSGWSPPAGAKEGTVYHVRRTRYHNYPVSIKQKHGGNQIWTIVKNIDGDIWTCAEKLLKHLEEVKGAEVAMSINEYAKRVVYKGVFKEDVINWLKKEGF